MGRRRRKREKSRLIHTLLEVITVLYDTLCSETNNFSQPGDILVSIKYDSTPSENLYSASRPPPEAFSAEYGSTW